MKNQGGIALFLAMGKIINKERPNSGVFYFFGLGRPDGAGVRLFWPAVFCGCSLHLLALRQTPAV